MTQWLVEGAFVVYLGVAALGMFGIAHVSKRWRDAEEETPGTHEVGAGEQVNEDSHGVNQEGEQS